MVFQVSAQMGIGRRMSGGNQRGRNQAGGEGPFSFRGVVAVQEQRSLEFVPEVGTAHRHRPVVVC